VEERTRRKQTNCAHVTEIIDQHLYDTAIENINVKRIPQQWKQEEPQSVLKIAKLVATLSLENLRKYTII